MLLGAGGCWGLGTRDSGLTTRGIVPAPVALAPGTQLLIVTLTAGPSHLTPDTRRLTPDTWPLTPAFQNPAAIEAKSA